MPDGLHSTSLAAISSAPRQCERIVVKLQPLPGGRTLRRPSPTLRTRARSAAPGRPRRRAACEQLGPKQMPARESRSRWPPHIHQLRAQPRRVSSRRRRSTRGRSAAPPSRLVSGGPDSPASHHDVEPEFGQRRTQAADLRRTPAGTSSDQDERGSVGTRPMIQHRAPHRDLRPGGCAGRVPARSGGGRAPPSPLRAGTHRAQRRQARPRKCSLTAPAIGPPMAWTEERDRPQRHHPPPHVRLRGSCRVLLDIERTPRSSSRPVPSRQRDDQVRGSAAAVTLPERRCGPVSGPTRSAARCHPQPTSTAPAPRGGQEAVAAGVAGEGVAGHDGHTTNS